MEPTVTRPLQLFVRGGALQLEDGRTIDVGPDPLLIGRDAACQVVIDDQEVSAMHAEVCAMPQGVRVRDLESTNGTFVGPARIQEAWLVDAATVTIGSTRIAFRPTPKARVDVGYAASFGALVGRMPATRRKAAAPVPACP